MLNPASDSSSLANDLNISGVLYLDYYLLGNTYEFDVF